MKRIVLTYFIFCITGVLFATNYYCDPVNGNDSNNGLSPNTAFASLSKSSNSLLKLLKSGDTIFVMQGNHGEVLLKDWKFQNDVFIVNYQHSKVKFDKLNIRNSMHLSIDEIEIQKLKTKEYNDYLVSIFESQYITVQNCNIHSAASINDYIKYEDWWNNTTDGVLIRKGSHNTFINNSIEFTMFAFMILNCDHTDITNNEISYFGGDGARIAGSSYINFQYNYIHDNISLMPNTPNPKYKNKWGKPVGTHQDLLQAYTHAEGQKPGVGSITNNIISNNTLISVTDSSRPYKGTAQGMWLGDGFHEDYTIENNLILTSTYNGLGIEGAVNCIIRNNTILDPYGSMPYHPYSLPQDQHETGSPIWIILRKRKTSQGGEPSTKNQVYNNIVEHIKFYQEDFEGQYGSQNNNLILSDESEYATEFIAPLNSPYIKNNYWLKENSSAIDTGTDSASKDLIETSRPQGNGFDIGCFEYKIKDTGPKPEEETHDNNFVIYILNTSLIIDTHNDFKVNHVECYDILGKLIFEEEVKALSKYQKRLETISSGIYIVVVNHNESEKLILVK